MAAADMALIGLSAAGNPALPKGMLVMPGKPGCCPTPLSAGCHVMCGKGVHGMMGQFGFRSQLSIFKVPQATWRAACGFVSMPSDWKMALTSLGCCAGAAKGCTLG